MHVDEKTWAAVRHAYADVSVPLSDIGRQHGLTPLAIGARARREDWPGREERARLKPTAKENAAKGKAAKESAVKGKNTAADAPPSRAAAKKKPHAGLPTRRTQAALVGRLYRAISLKLEHMEMRMASGEARSAQDEERESRALATLINNFEKVTEAVAELDRNRDAAHARGTAGADAERMRREIAERLERLGGSGALEPRSCKPRS